MNIKDNERYVNIEGTHSKKGTAIILILEVTAGVVSWVHERILFL